MGMFSNLILASYTCISIGLHIQSTYDHHVWKGKKLKTIFVQLLVDLPSRLPIIILKNFIFLKSINEKSLKVIGRDVFQDPRATAKTLLNHLAKSKIVVLKKAIT